MERRDGIIVVGDIADPEHRRQLLDLIRRTRDELAPEVLRERRPSPQITEGLARHMALLKNTLQTKKRRSGGGAGFFRHLPHPLTTLAEEERRRPDGARSWASVKKREAKRKRLLRARVGRIQHHVNKISKKDWRKITGRGPYAAMHVRQDIVTAVCAGKL